MEWFTNPEIWISFITLTALEIVLGIDNLVFISILADKLPEKDRERGSRVGLAMAMFLRIALLLSIAWITRLTAPFFTVFSQAISGRDLILLVGGLFLIGKSTFEIHDKLEGEEGHSDVKAGAATFRNVIFQILLLDIVFSLDSVITAVGIADEVGVMVAAIVIAVLVMMVSVNTISAFVNEHPTVKMLALSFLLLIGFSLVVEGLHQHIPKGYIYFAMSFSVFVEFLNLRLRSRPEKPVHLRKAYTEKKAE